jgi:hypothetical protein
MVAIALTRRELTAADLRAAAKSRDARAVRRILAIALVLEGVVRRTAGVDGGGDLRHGPADAAGLGPATMRRGSPGFRTGEARRDPRDSTAGKWPRSCPGWSRPRSGARSDGGRGGALAAAGSARPDRLGVRGGVARADGRQVPGGSRLPAALGAPAAPEDRPRRPGGVQNGPPRLQVSSRDDAGSVCANASGIGASSPPRWSLARPGPHKTPGVSCAIF